MSIYEVACKSFRNQILEKGGQTEEKCVQSEEEMKAYFCQFACDSSSPAAAVDQPSVSSQLHSASQGTTSNASMKFMAKRIYKGYMDDPRNTGIHDFSTTCSLFLLLLLLSPSNIY